MIKIYLFVKKKWKKGDCVQLKMKDDDDDDDEDDGVWVIWRGDDEGDVMRKMKMKMKRVFWQNHSKRCSWEEFADKIILKDEEDDDDWIIHSRHLMMMMMMMMMM